MNFFHKNCLSHFSSIKNIIVDISGMILKTIFMVHLVIFRYIIHRNGDTDKKIRKCFEWITLYVNTN